MMFKPFLRLAHHHVADTSCCLEFINDFPMRIRWQRSRVHTNGWQAWAEQCVNGILEWWSYEEQIFANGSPYLTP